MGSGPLTGGSGCASIQTTATWNQDLHNWSGGGLSVGKYRPLWYRLAGSDRRTATGTGQPSKVFPASKCPTVVGPTLDTRTPGTSRRHGRDLPSFPGLVRTQVGSYWLILSMDPAKEWATRPTESLQHRATAWWHWKRCGGTATDWVPCGHLNPEKG